MSPDVDEGQHVEEEAQDKSHPESVPWKQYVGVKEKLTKTETRFKEQIATLEEQLKKAPNAEEFTRITTELDALKTTHQETLTELETLKNSGKAEKIAMLKAKGVPEEKLEGLGMKELDLLAEAVGSWKPGPDFDKGGGGTGQLTGSPMDLAREAYASSNK